MMLNAWHLPVPPFVKQSKDQLLITLWLTGEDPPQRIMLRTEHDNEAAQSAAAWRHRMAGGDRALLRTTSAAL